MGRLAQPPHPELFRLLHESRLSGDLQHVLPSLLRIDAVHVVMLARAGILGREVARELLAMNRDWDERLARGEAVLTPPPSHRGLYLLYESHFIDRLGPRVGGAAHVARSRNDINATLVRLRLRERTLRLLAEAFSLVATTLEVAQAHLRTPMSAFTHLQPAQPTTLAHYLAAVTAEMLRALEAILLALQGVDRCPMGAGSGSGTSFPIDRLLVADLLGFLAIVDNSLDAVASRDFAVPILAGCANLGTTLTRWATDFQLWGSHAYGFLDWPDSLVSTSSIMPQKRNAYVWEDIRGQAVHPAGALVNVLIGMKGTPFSNSIEAGSEAMAHLWPALDGIEKAVRLTRLLVAHVEVRPLRLRRFLDGANVTMTALADHLVARHGLAFRSAHDAVGRLVGELPGGAVPAAAEIRPRLEAILAEELGRPCPLDGDLERVLDVEAVLSAMEHGGGPAPRTVAGQIEALLRQQGHLGDQVRSWTERVQEADRRFREAVAELAG